MKKNLFAWTLAFGTILNYGAAQTQAQQFDPTTVLAPGVTGNSNQFSVQGRIEEFIQFTAIDSNLEMGDLGGPKAIGERASFTLPGDAPNIVEVGRTGSENGFAGIEFGSNAFIRVRSNRPRLRNNGVDNTRNTGDDVFLPTQYSRGFLGRDVSIASPGNISYGDTQGAYVGLSQWSGVLANDNTFFSDAIYAPSPLNGLKFRARVTRSGLNNYRGDYTGIINVTYFKY